jgi:hypothetical protein
MFLFGVKSFSIDSIKVYWTVCLIEVKLAVFVSSNEFLTDLQISCAISIDTFLSVRLFENDSNIGSKSYSVNVLFPIIF